jgi:hypothetical protein
MSMTVLTSELAVIYQAYFDGKPCPLEPLQIQYGDFSVWQKEFLEGPEMKRQLAYWKKRLDGMTELDLPTDFPRPPVKTWKGEIISTLLPKDLTDRLQASCAAIYQATPASADFSAMSARPRSKRLKTRNSPSSASCASCAPSGTKAAIRFSRSISTTTAPSPWRALSAASL